MKSLRPYNPALCLLGGDNPAMRQPLADLLGKEGILPQVSMGQTNYVSAFMHQAPESLAVHFVNYDYDPESDAVAPVGPLKVEISLLEGFPRDDISVYFVTPGGENIKLDARTSEDQLLLTLPGIEVWSILWIGNENALQAVMAKNPTPTPLPSPTATPSAQQLSEGGYIIYGDGLSEGWRAASDGVKLFLASTEDPYQGGQAIALNAEGWGWLDLSYRETVDNRGFNSLVLHVNPGETDNLEFSVTIFNNEQSVNYVFLSSFLGGQPLEKNAWRRVVIPLSDLNPQGAAFNRIFFQNESDNPASFALDEIFFAAQE